MRHTCADADSSEIHHCGGAQVRHERHVLITTHLQTTPTQTRIRGVVTKAGYKPRITAIRAPLHVHDVGSDAHARKAQRWRT
jgi:hypothetical protein